MIKWLKTFFIGETPKYLVCYYLRRDFDSKFERTFVSLKDAEKFLEYKKSHNYVGRIIDIKTQEEIK